MPEIKLTNTKFLRAFVDKMLEDKGIPEAERMKLRDGMVRDIDDKIETAMLESLSMEQLGQLNQMLDEGADDAKLEGFFAQIDGDYTKPIEKVLMDYRKNFLHEEEA